MKRILLSAFLSALFCTWATAESSVWKAQKEDSVIYLGGTIHLLRPSDLPLPEEFDAAYKETDLLVFETDITELKSPATQQKIMANAMYTDGSTIDQHISPETYALLVNYGAENGLPVEALKSFKPSMIALTLLSIELMKENVTEEGVDSLFYNRAVQDKKSTEFLETVDEQISFITQMGKGNEDALISYTIRDIEKTKSMFEDIVGAWKDGDADKLNALMIEGPKELPELYEQLLAGRNRKWMQKIEVYQATPAKEFILVGVAHLIGPDGILAALKKQGFSIEQVQPVAD